MPEPDTLSDIENKPPGSSSTASSWDIDDGVDTARDDRANEVNSPTARKSFWLGICGIAVLCISSIGISVIQHEFIISPLSSQTLPAFQTNAANSARWIGQRFIDNSLKASVFGLCFTTLLPILLWRGYLGLRFFIALTLFTNILFLFGELATAWATINSRMISTKLTYILAVVLCWSLIYPLAQLSVWNGRPLLRSFCIYAALAISACVSIASVGQPSPALMAAATGVFALLVAATLLVRRFLGLATLEADVTSNQIMRASLESLVALTSIAAVFITVVAAWGTLVSFSDQVDRILWASGFVIESLWISVFVFAVSQRRISSRLGVFVFGVSVAISTLLAITNGIMQDWQLINLSLFESGHMILRVGLSIFVILWLWLWGAIVSRWLRFCGWTIGKAL